MLTSLKFNSIGFAVLSALSLSLSVHAAEVDAEKAMSISNYVLGIEPSARGNKFELLKTSPLGSGNGATAGGFFGTALTGVNPFSSAGVHSAGGISLALDALSLLSKKEVKEPLYDEMHIHGNIFGKYYLSDLAENEKEARNKMIADTIANLKKTSLEVYGKEIDFESRADKFFDGNAFSIRVGSINTNGKEIALNIKLYALIKTKDNIDLENKLLGFKPTYESKYTHGVDILVVIKDQDESKFSNKTKEFAESQDGATLLAGLTNGGKLVLLTSNLRQTFYDGNMYYEVEQAPNK